MSLKLVVDNKPRGPGFFNRNRDEVVFSLWMLLGGLLLAYVVYKMETT